MSMPTMTRGLHNLERWGSATPAPHPTCKALLPVGMPNKRTISPTSK